MKVLDEGITLGILVIVSRYFSLWYHCLLLSLASFRCNKAYTTWGFSQDLGNLEIYLGFGEFADLGNFFGA